MGCDATSIYTVAATLAAAFFGAWFAFLLDARARTKRIEDDHVRNGNLALYNISDYWSALKQYHKEVVEPYEGKQDAWLNMPPVTKRYRRSASLRELDLSFILETPHVEVYAQVYLEENRYHTIRILIEEREALILNRVRPAMAEAGVKEYDSLSLDDVRKIIGDNVASLLEKMTTGIISQVRESLASLQDTHDLLRGVMIELYPKRTIISVQFYLDEAEGNREDRE